jgi:hypothetical protein
MGTILFILIFGAVYLIIYVVKSLGSALGEVDGKRTLGENFPQFEVLEPQQENSAHVTSVDAARSIDAGRRRNNSASHKAAVAVSSAPEKKSEETARKERLVKIENKTDAKRAFLYSEIFSRKY